MTFPIERAQRACTFAHYASRVTRPAWSRCLLAALLLALPTHPLPAQRSTRSGVYTTEQATRGRDTYVMMCKSCHTPASHTGATFAGFWEGHAVAELFAFISTRMPKNDPGSLSPDEYAALVAYLLQMNAMPAGRAELPADSASLASIRIETAADTSAAKKPTSRPPTPR